MIVVDGGGVVAVVHVWGEGRGLASKLVEAAVHHTLHEEVDIPAAGPRHKTNQLKTHAMSYGVLGALQGAKPNAPEHFYGAPSRRRLCP